jgi:hypothetical protein
MRLLNDGRRAMKADRDQSNDQTEDSAPERFGSRGAGKLGTRKVQRGEPQPSLPRSGFVQPGFSLLLARLSSLIANKPLRYGAMDFLTFAARGGGKMRIG